MEMLHVQTYRLISLYQFYVAYGIHEKCASYSETMCFFLNLCVFAEMIGDGFVVV